MMSYSRPKICDALARQLRQEAGFGCVQCGHPYVEYHHIVPWAEEHHYRADDMVAVCPTCHSMFAHMNRRKQYRLKENPHNIKHGLVKGAMAYDKVDMKFRLGNNEFINVPKLIKFFNVPLIECRIDDGELFLNLRLFDSKGFQIFSIKDNQVQFRYKDYWDCTFKYNYIALRSAPRKIELIIDFRGEDIFIIGNFSIGNQIIKVDKNLLKIDNNTFEKTVMSNMGVGIQIGNPNQLFIPSNFAMNNPQMRVLSK